MADIISVIAGLSELATMKGASVEMTASALLNVFKANWEKIFRQRSKSNGRILVYFFLTPTLFDVPVEIYSYYSLFGLRYYFSSIVAMATIPVTTFGVDKIQDSFAGIIEKMKEIGEKI